jgi:hypothetical protein
MIRRDTGILESGLTENAALVEANDLAIDASLIEPA